MKKNADGLFNTTRNPFWFTSAELLTSGATPQPTEYMYMQYKQFS